MTATRTISKFVIALCPATPIYYDGPTNWQYSGGYWRIIYAGTNKDDACRFDTFDAAVEVSRNITGWGGRRVEEIAVEVEDDRVTLDTPEARIDVRDNATAQYSAAREAGYAERRAADEVANDLRGCGLKVAVVYRDGASCAVTLNLADHLGNLLDLDWDVGQDGFSYETEGDDACDLAEEDAQHEDEPEYSDAESGTQPIFRALRGLTTEQKIVALANALLAAQTTICRAEEDGHQVIRAILPNCHPHLGTATVLNIP